MSAWKGGGECLQKTDTREPGLTTRNVSTLTWGSKTCPRAWQEVLKCQDRQRLQGEKVEERGHKQIPENLEIAPFFMVHQLHKQMNKGWQLKCIQNPRLDNKKNYGAKEKNIVLKIMFLTTITPLSSLWKQKVLLFISDSLYWVLCEW